MNVVHEAVARARSGGGPQLIVADLLRLVGHGEHDDFNYLNHALKTGPIGRDCMDVARAQLTERSWMTAAQVDAMRDQAQAEVEEACSTALREPLPDPNEEEWFAIQTRSLAEGAAE